MKRGGGGCAGWRALWAKIRSAPKESRWLRGDRGEGGSGEREKRRARGCTTHRVLHTT